MDYAELKKTLAQLEDIRAKVAEAEAQADLWSAFSAVMPPLIAALRPAYDRVEAKAQPLKSLLQKHNGKTFSPELLDAICIYVREIDRIFEIFAAMTAEVERMKLRHPWMKLEVKTQN